MLKKIMGLLLIAALLCPFVVAADEEENLLKNGGFEEMTADGTGIEGWTPYGNTWTDNEYVAIDQKRAYDGDNAVTVTASNKNAWVRQLVYNVIPGATYELSFMYSGVIAAGSPGALKVEFYDANVLSVETAMGFASTPTSYGSTNGKYKEYKTTFPAEEGAVMMALYLRVYGGVGHITYDNVRLRVSKLAPKALFSVDRYFYYPENETGYADITFSKNYQYDGSDLMVSQLLDGDTVLEEQKDKVDGTPLRFTYPLSHLKEKKKEYIVRGTLYDAKGAVVESYDEGIYLYDRPTALAADGTYMVDGKPFDPVILYHAFAGEYDKYKEMGANVLQATSLDKAQEHGMMCFAVLYATSAQWGSDAWFKGLELSVRNDRDHPALFAWALADEPTYAITTQERVDILKRASKIVRDLDPVHPVYIMEVPLDNGVAVRRTAKCEDVVPIDPYPLDVESRSTIVGTMVGRSVEIAGADKPVYSVIHAFNYGGLLPTENNIISYLYQSLIYGARGLGYYSFDDCLNGSYTKYEGDAPQLYASHMWEPITRFAQNAQADGFAHFARRETPPYSGYYGDDYLYHSYVKGKDLYMIILNRNNKEKTVNIPLTSYDGKHAIADFEATDVLGNREKLSGNGTLSVKLVSDDAMLLKITPKAGVSTSGLSWDAFDAYIEESKAATYFNDLTGYDWAAAQVEALYKKGIVNTKGENVYAPAQSITRGEFAMYLVRTLGLDEEIGENFDDVDADAEYAQEVAIGKAAGILNGVGDNKYNPEAEITRQDLMTIIARGTKLTETADLSAFSDSALIADYARDFVSAMVAEGLVQGNADGTINPLGNTTRAEAAVIMQRIIEMMEKRALEEWGNKNVAH